MMIWHAFRKGLLKVLAGRLIAGSTSLATSRPRVFGPRSAPDGRSGETDATVGALLAPFAPGQPDDDRIEDRQGAEPECVQRPDDLRCGHHLADLARMAPTERRPWRRSLLSDRQVRCAGRKLVAGRLPGMCFQRSACRPGLSANLYGMRARSSSASRTMLAGLEFRQPRKGRHGPGPDRLERENEQKNRADEPTGAARQRPDLSLIHISE